MSLQPACGRKEHRRAGTVAMAKSEEDALHVHSASLARFQPCVTPSREAGRGDIA